MPQFVNETSNSGISIINKDYFKINTNMRVKCDIIEENIRHYTNILFPPLISLNMSINQKDVLLSELSIELGNTDFCPTYPNSSIDESCIVFRLRFN